jgi:ABC-type branched-subunit amino acid transport system permease subunit
MLQRLRTQLDSISHGLQVGIGLGIGYIFLTLIGIPAGATRDTEPLADLAVPLYILIAAVLGWWLTSKYQANAFRRLITNILALGIAAGVTFLLFLGLINSWHEEGIDVKGDYFEKMDTKPMAILSGVPVEELFTNPEPNRITGEYTEDVQLRTNPMQLYTEEKYALVSIGDNIHLGGFYGLAVLIILGTGAGALSQNLLRRVDWRQLWKDSIKSLDKSAYGNWVRGTVHWLVLCIPLWLFILLWLTFPQETDVPLLEDFGLAAEEATQYIDLEEELNLRPGSLVDDDRFVQLGISFLIVISGVLTVTQYSRQEATPLPYVARVAIGAGLVIVLALVALLRIEAHETYFVSPASSLRLFDLDSRGWSLLIYTLLVIGLLVFVFLGMRKAERYQFVFTSLLAICLILITPLYMDRFQTFTMGRVALAVMFGLGLNIVVGYAGLLDLGYVAFYAIGAYTYAFIALESNQSKLGLEHLNSIGLASTMMLLIAPIVIFSTALFWKQYTINQQQQREAIGEKPASVSEATSQKAPAPWHVSVLIAVWIISLMLGVPIVLDLLDIVTTDESIFLVIGLLMSLITPIITHFGSLSWQRSVNQQRSASTTEPNQRSFLATQPALYHIIGLAVLAIGLVATVALAFSEAEYTLLGISINWTNVLFLTIIAGMLLPFISLSLGWTAYRKAGVTAKSAGAKAEILTKKPVWVDQPPWYVMLSLISFSIFSVLIIQLILVEQNIIEIDRFSSFIISIIVSLLVAAFAGFTLGVPVLRLRGDYLAIVTLGFGEIISLALNNLDETTGGPKGALEIPKPITEGTTGATSNLIFLYLAIMGAILVLFISARLRNSRIGRAWLAMRSDEDIAQAMGINLVNVKLLAFSIGASFAGLAGMLFSAQQANIFPPDFNLNKSIEGLSLVVIGGMGSLPGVVVGSIMLIGLPEILRPVSNYRIMAFGLLLILTMVSRPVGILPAPPPELEDEARQLSNRESDETEDGE